MLWRFGPDYLLTVHGDLVAFLRILALGLNGHLRGGRGTEKSVGVDVPLVRLPVVCDRLDQVTVGGTHANPKGGIARGSRGRFREDESGGGFADP